MAQTVVVVGKRGRPRLKPAATVVVPKVETVESPQIVIGGSGKRGRPRKNPVDGQSQSKQRVAPPNSSLLYTEYMGRIDEFRQLDEAVQTQAMRSAFKRLPKVHCLNVDCTSTQSSMHGLKYHLERCGLTADKRPWKCWRCGTRGVQSDSVGHLRLCRPPKTTTDDDGDDMCSAAIAAVNECLFGDKTETRKRTLRKLVQIDDNDKNDANYDGELLEDDEDDDDNSLNDNRRRSKKHKSTNDRRSYSTKESVKDTVTNDELLDSIPPRTRFKFKSRDLCGKKMTDSDRRYYLKAARSAYEQFCSTHAKVVSNVISAWKCLIDEWLPLTNSNLPAELANKRSVPVSLQSEDESQRINLFSSITTGANNKHVGYCGGPISSISFAPSLLDDGAECIAVTIYDDDELLVATDIAQKTRHYVQLWTLQMSQPTAGPSAIEKLEIGILLASDYGVILSSCWCPVGYGQLDECDGRLGALALATGSGIPNKFPKNGKKAGPIIVAPKPIAILLAEHDNCISPIITICWTHHNGGQLIAATTAAGTVSIWNLEYEDKQNEPHYPMKPYWVMCNADWMSPPIDVAFVADNHLAVSFREKMIRIYDIESMSCLFEDSTSRMAGSRLISCPSILPGLLTYQTDQLNILSALVNTPVYITYRSQSDNCAIVPLPNRHYLPIWHVTVSPLTATIAAVGGDGSVTVSINGRVTPFGMQTPMSSCHSNCILGIKAQRVRPEADDKDEILPTICITNEQCADEFCLLISDKADKTTLIRDQIALSTCADLPLAALHAASFSAHHANVLCVGGQAGLLIMLNNSFVC